MNENWTIRRLLGTATHIEVVEYLCEFTHDDMPGVSDATGGMVMLPMPILRESATKQQIVDAVKALHGDNWGHILGLHNQQLGFLYAAQNGGDLDLDGIEAPQPITVEQVIAERERRLGLGFDYDFGDARGVNTFGTTRSDMRGWDEVDKLAANLRAAGQGSQTITVLTNTGPVEITADEWPLIMIAAGAFRQPIWAASFVLQAMDPIPADYADNAYWP